MMIAANLPKKVRHKMFPCAFSAATNPDNLVLMTINGTTKTRYEHWRGKFPGFVKNIRTWGEAGTVKVKSKTSPKLNNKGTNCVLVGYPDNFHH